MPIRGKLRKSTRLSTSSTSCARKPTMSPNRPKRSKTSRLSSSPLKSRNSTILVDSSIDCDIIDASIEEMSCEFDWIRTPRAARLRSQQKATPAALSPLSAAKRKNSCGSRCSASASRVSKRLKSIEDSPLVDVLPQDHTEPVAKVTPPKLVFLAGSKLQNVEAWLTSTAKKGESQEKMDYEENDAKLDEILKSVYGNTWAEKAFNECKSFDQITPTTNSKLATTGKEDVASKPPKSVSKVKKPVRRKIFSGLANQNQNEKINDTPIEHKPNSFPVPTPVLTIGSARKTKPSLRSSSAMTPCRTFLSSLAPSTPTSIAHPEALDFKVHFKKKKDELVARLFKLYNVEVFENRLPEDTEITWNTRMRGTAGFCYCKRKRNRSGEIALHARIELSPKVIDRADRLRDTLIHEMCHAAAWLIDGVLDDHGPIWVEWTRKARQRFPELPVIKRCHNYEIESKYVYKCTKCEYQINRHSKSIDVDRKRCGKCYGVFQLFTRKKVPGKRENPQFDITRTLRAPNPFALFVKDNYKTVKDSHPELKHKEIMKIISAQYAVSKKD